MAEWVLKPVCFGMHLRSGPLAFPLDSRCHGELGLRKRTRIQEAIVDPAQRDSSLP